MSARRANPRDVFAEGPHAETYLDLSKALRQAGRTAETVAAFERGESLFPFPQAIRNHLVAGGIRLRLAPGGARP